jgi:hypothetical protein
MSNGGGLQTQPPDLREPPLERRLKVLVVVSRPRDSYTLKGTPGSGGPRRLPREAEMTVLRKCKDLWLWVAVVSPSTTETGTGPQSVPPNLRRPPMPLPQWSGVAAATVDSPGRNAPPHGAAVTPRRHELRG